MQYLARRYKRIGYLLAKAVCSFPSTSMVQTAATETGRVSRFANHADSGNGPRFWEQNEGMNPWV